MKLHCPISGLYYSAPYLHYAPYTTTAIHPALTLDDKHLIRLVEQSDAPENLALETTDQRVSYYLLHVALLAKLPVQFRQPLDYDTAYPQLVQHSQALRAAFIHTLAAPQHELPGYAVDKNNPDLHNLAAYLTAVRDAISARQRTVREHARQARIEAREAKLDTLIYAQAKYQITQLSKLMPEWAELACGGFPAYEITLSNGDQTTLRDAWKQAITHSMLGEHYRIIGKYRKADIQELIDHLEDNLEIGTPYCSKLLRALRATLDTMQEFLAPRKAAPVVDLSALDDLGTPETASASAPSTPRLTLQQLLLQRRTRK